MASSHLIPQVLTQARVGGCSSWCVSAPFFICLKAIAKKAKYWIYPVFSFFFEKN